MSSPPGPPKKKISETVSFVKTTNPEVFHIQPRPGGVLPIKTRDFNASLNIAEEDEAEQAKKEFPSQVKEQISKEFRVQTALDETESLDSEDVTLPNPLKDAMYMFGVTISTVIMMAANHSNIPEDYLNWTTQCLGNVKDEFGNHPPNIQGILNHMKFLNPQTSGGGAGPPPPQDGVDGDGRAGAFPSEGERAEPPPDEETGGDDVAAGAETAYEGDREEEERGVEERGAGEREAVEYKGDQTIKTTARVKMGSQS